MFIVIFGLVGCQGGISGNVKVVKVDCPRQGWRGHGVGGPNDYNTRPDKGLIIPRADALSTWLDRERIDFKTEKLVEVA